MPGLFGAAARASSDVRALPLAGLGARLCSQPGLRAALETTRDGRAVLGAADLRILPGSGLPHRASDGSLAIIHGELHDLDPGVDPAAVVLERYRADPGALAALRGSYVAAIWDASRGVLVLTNDRFGLRNLYYAVLDGVLVFAPLVGALRALPGVDSTVDLGAVADFLAFDHVLGDRTLLHAVRALPPASCLRFDGGTVEIERYWAPTYRPETGREPADLADELAAHLGAATRRALCGPGRPGLPLSGGLDSRAIVSAVGDDLVREVPCFTYGMPGSDDLRLGAELAAMLGLPHHALELAPGWVAAGFDEMVRLTDGMHLGLNVHAVTLQQCAERSDLLVLGNGGDCVLDRLWWWRDDVSDPRIFARRMFERVNLGLGPSRAPGLLASTLLGEYRDGSPERLRARLSRYPGATAADVADAFNVGERHTRWVLQGVPAQATHVEFRQPFYDYDVVDFALRVPGAIRAQRRLHAELIRRCSPRLAALRRQGSELSPAAPAALQRAAYYRRRVERLARRALRRLAPRRRMPDRPRLRGFADYDHELRHGSRRLLDELVLGAETLDRGWYRPDALRRLVGEHLERRANHARLLGAIATVEAWVRGDQDTLVLPPINGFRRGRGGRSLLLSSGLDHR